MVAKLAVGKEESEGFPCNLGEDVKEGETVAGAAASVRGGEGVIEFSAFQKTQESRQILEMHPETMLLIRRISSATAVKQM